MSKVLWFVGGGRESVPALLHARELGYRLIVSDGNCEAPGLLVADYPMVISTYDEAANCEAALNFRQAGGQIDGVLSHAADVPKTVAALAATLGLSGISYEAASLSADKLLMKQRFIEHSIPTAAFQAVRTIEEVQQFARNYPDFIIKPVDSRGARGVTHWVFSNEENKNITPKKIAPKKIKWALELAINASPTGRAMVEEYLQGTQYSTEGFIIDGKPYPIITAERNYARLQQFAPFIIEDGGAFPPNLPEAQENDIANLALEAGLALGGDHCVVKGDMVLTPKGAKVIEVALRASGGYLSSHTVPLGVGVDFIRILCELACGEIPNPQSLKPEFKQAVAIRYFFPEQQGMLSYISGVEQSLANPNISFIHLAVSKGSKMTQPNDHTARAGCVHVTNPSLEGAITLAEACVDSIKFHITP